LNQLKQIVPQGVGAPNEMMPAQAAYSPVQALVRLMSNGLITDPQIASKAVDLLDTIKMRIEEASGERMTETKTTGRKR
jgi:hypothetical protein